MNLKRLKEAEKEFLKKYPGGFENPAMLELVKKHQPAKMKQMAAENFGKARFKQSDEIIGAMIKVVTASSMVSVFEKPRFRDEVRMMAAAEQEALVGGLKSRLHGSERRGFTIMLDILSAHKLAKWTLMTVIPAYYRPDDEVFIKPTTTKNIIANLELDLVYRPRPSWEFYEPYREIINKLKKKVSPTLSPSNAAFSGFMMMAFE